MNETAIRLLVVDDERPIRRLLNAALGSEYTVFEAATGEEGMAAAVSQRPDAIILDLGLPDMDGIKVIRCLREWTSIPILVISVREREQDKIAAIDAGADDYLTKPFGVGELMARIRAVLRRVVVTVSDPVFRSGHLEIDLGQRVVRVAGQPVSLTPTEYDILRALIQHAGKVLTHQQLIRLVWGSIYEVEPHLLRVNISNLRRKIEVDPIHPDHIVTEPGVGYRLRLSQ